MKTMKAGAVVLLGLVLAAPAWGLRGWGAPWFKVDPNDPLRCEVGVDIRGTPDIEGISRETWWLHIKIFTPHQSHTLPKKTNARWTGSNLFWGPIRGEQGPTDINQTFSCGRFAWGTLYGAILTMTPSAEYVYEYTTPPEPEPPEPEPPAPPPEPEPPEPEPPEPEPEIPDPEEPDHTHPVERCDHIAIVAAMPKALPGDEDAADHWVRITNPGAASIRFTIEGRDEAGAKGGTYRRELPAYRSVKVKMRDIQAAFDVTDPEGWWWLRVAGSGPIDVAATMKQGDARRFVPVKVPATCGTGPVTRR